MYRNEKLQRSTISKLENDTYQYHKQNTSTSTDIIWKKESHTCTCHSDPCTCTITFINTSKDEEEMKAVLEKNTIYIYYSDILIDTLYRSSEVCPHITTPVPTLNVLDLYELITIHKEEYNEMVQLLSDKRICATTNDWNMTSSEFMAKGIFIMDRAGTCFYYVPYETMELIKIWKENVMPRIVSVNELQHRTFLGSMTS
jgi:hypothetical protein